MQARGGERLKQDKPDMELNLTGRTAVITGGSRGIGRAVAEELAAEGVNLHLAARSEDDLKSAASSIISKYGVDVAIHAGDLSDSDVINQLAQECRNVDILVNNAGAIPRGNLLEVEEDRWRVGWDLKVFGFINLTRSIYGAMCERGSGVIVNVIGMGGLRADANYIAGSTGNAALIMFTQAMGGESVRHGVRVVGVNPGPVATEKYIGDAERLAAERFGDKDRWPELMSKIPMGRAARPDEVSPMVAFLASDKSAYISGAMITIDGGLLVDPSIGVKR
jgi:NAD(P)-dependent dehydrogenase (short-subunit alcohol dehydrogenase family)